jgi:lysozyme
VEESLKARIKRHEGLSLKPYVDSRGFCTIGYGHKIESITEEQAEDLLKGDLGKAWAEVLNQAPRSIWNKLNQARREVLVEMAFQLGGRGLMSFKKMFRALMEDNYELAAEEMLDSLWYKQTPKRAIELAKIMKTGKADRL